MDIHTPKGQESRQQERDAVRIFNTHFPDTTYKFAHDFNSKLAISGGLINKRNELIGVVKTKCRQDSLATFQTTYRWEWMITKAAMIDAAAFADTRLVPLWGFLYLVPQKILLIKMLYHNGEWKVRQSSRQTESQATINGGTATRMNMFLDIRDADRFTINVEGLNFAMLSDDPKGEIQ